MARAKTATAKNKNGQGAGVKPAPETYRHPEATSLLRPDVGTQAQFKKKKPPATYRYDSSLSPVLQWDGQNPAREKGEELIARILEAGTLETKAGELKDPEALIKALEAELEKVSCEETVWDRLAGTISAPFEAGEQRQIAVKVIDDRGNELLAVQGLP